MRIAHTCYRCGFDLTRRNAPLDPVYGLPIIVCPKCAAAVVRREHPTVIWTHQILRVIGSSFSLASRLIGTLLIAIVVIALSETVSKALRPVLSGSARFDEAAAAQSIMWLLASVVAGFWTGLIFVHLRRWQVALAWLLVLAILPFAAWYLALMDQLLTGVTYNRSFWNHALRQANRSLPSGWILIFSSWAIALAAMPAGRWSGLGWQVQRRRSAWRKERRKKQWNRSLLSRA